MSDGQSRLAGRRSTAVAIVLCAAVGMLLLLLGGPAIAVSGIEPASEQAARSENDVSALARVEIPPLYLRLYVAAARRYGIDWAILAGIGKVECDNGRDLSPSCTKEGVDNAAGAGGPMQFLASTWAMYGVDGNGDGRADRWDPADAIFSAAHYLHESGAPSDYRDAIYAYNHAWWYVAEVESWAARYRGRAAGVASKLAASTDAGGIGADSRSAEGWPAAGRRAISQSQTSTQVLYVSGEQAQLLRGDGHLALIPEGVPPAVQAMLVAGNELQDLPYGPAGHPDPLGASSEDCSSTVNYVLYKAGVRSLTEIVQQNPLAQDYVHWGAPGPGRWVTIYATDVPTPHVFVVVAGLRLDTVGGATDEGPNRLQGGPRWRLSPQIPTWAQWSVRHPWGL